MARHNTVIINATLRQVPIDFAREVNALYPTIAHIIARTPQLYAILYYARHMHSNETALDLLELCMKFCRLHLRMNLRNILLVSRSTKELSEFYKNLEHGDAHAYGANMYLALKSSWLNIEACRRELDRRRTAPPKYVIPPYRFGVFYLLDNGPNASTTSSGATTSSGVESKSSPHIWYDRTNGEIITEQTAMRRIAADGRACVYTSDGPQRKLVACTKSYPHYFVEKIHKVVKAGRRDNITRYGVYLTRIENGKPRTIWIIVDCIDGVFVVTHDDPIAVIEAILTLRDTAITAARSFTIKYGNRLPWYDGSDPEFPHMYSQQQQMPTRTSAVSHVMPARITPNTSISGVSTRIHSHLLDDILQMNANDQDANDQDKDEITFTPIDATPIDVTAMTDEEDDDDSETSDGNGLQPLWHESDFEEPV